MRLEQTVPDAESTWSWSNGDCDRSSLKTQEDDGSDGTARYEHDKRDSGNCGLSSANHAFQSQLNPVGSFAK